MSRTANIHHTEIHDPSLDHAPIMMTADEAASALRVSRATFWRRVADGTLPSPVRIGGVTRWRREELLARIDEIANQQRLEPR